MTQKPSKGAEASALPQLLDRVEAELQKPGYSILRGWLAIHGGASARIVLEEVTQLVRTLGGEASARPSPPLVQLLRAEADEAARRGYQEASNAYHVSANMVEQALAGLPLPSPDLQKDEDSCALGTPDASSPTGSSRLPTKGCQR